MATHELQLQALENLLSEGLKNVVDGVLPIYQGFEFNIKQLTEALNQIKKTLKDMKISGSKVVVIINYDSSKVKQKDALVYFNATVDITKTLSNLKRSKGSRGPF